MVDLMKYILPMALESYYKNIRNNSPDDKYINNFPNDLKSFHVNEDAVFHKGENIHIQLHPLMPDHPPIPHTHGFFEITYIYKGELIHEIENNTFSQESNQVILLNLKACHNVWIKQQNDIAFNIMIKKSAVENILTQIISNDNPIFLFFLDSVYKSHNNTNYIMLETNENLVYIFNKIIQEYFEQKDFYEPKVMSYLLQLFSEFARNYKTENEKINLPVGNKSTDVLNYIMQNYSNITLEALSEKFNYSRRQMGRLISEWTGTSFTEIINNYRIERACKMVQNTNLPVSKIVEIVGFSDNSYFYKIFKKKKGIYFSEFKEQFR